LRYKLQGELVETLTNIIGLRGIKVLRKKNAAECWLTHGYHPTSNKRMSLRRQSEFAPAQLLMVRRRAVFASLTICLCRQGRRTEFQFILRRFVVEPKGFSGESASKLVEFVEPITLSAKQRLQGESITTRPEDSGALRTAQKPA
jgi:hypothetical protein